MSNITSCCRLSLAEEEKKTKKNFCEEYYCHLNQLQFSNVLSHVAPSSHLLSPSSETLPKLLNKLLLAFFTMAAAAAEHSHILHQQSPESTCSSHGTELTTNIILLAKTETKLPQTRNPDLQLEMLRWRQTSNLLHLHSCEMPYPAPQVPTKGSELNQATYTGALKIKNKLVQQLIRPP